MKKEEQVRKAIRETDNRHFFEHEGIASETEKKRIQDRPFKVYDSDNLDEFARDLKAFLESGKPGDSIEVGLDPTPGIFDEVNYATIIEHPTGKAVLIHAACEGDWTRAMLIPEEHFDEDITEDSYVVEGLYHHMYGHL